MLGLPAAGRLLPRDRRCGGANILSSVLPNFFAPLREGGQFREIPWVNNIPDVGGHLAEEKDLLDLFHRCGLQGIELVHQDWWFVCPEAGMVLPFDDSLVLTEAVWAQQKLVIWVIDDAGVVAKQADGVNQLAGSLESAQWNLVRGFMTRLTAKVALMLRNQAWSASA
jgi:hypothetical protein